MRLFPYEMLDIADKARVIKRSAHFFFTVHHLVLTH
jgi:hypothetical protein